MTKSEITKDMKSFLNGSCWITRKELATYFGCDYGSKKIRSVIKSLPKFGNQYAVIDIAERVTELQTYK